jgi:hypothetical protein
MADGYGLELDEWQRTVVRAWMRTKDDRWCAGTWCVSVPRQNGKNAALEAVELYCTVVLGLKILHTSHTLDSARKAIQRVRHFFGTKVEDPQARFPELNALVKTIRKTNGQECIELVNGGIIEISARTESAGRGSSFDVLVIDEAQQYEADEQEALKPTISAAPGGDPVTIFMGTPPAEISERGEPFVRVRSNALLGKAKRTAWVEWSPDADVDEMSEDELAVFVADRRNWAVSNPALGIRVLAGTVEDELAEFRPRSFARERLNMWPRPDKTVAVISQTLWNKRLGDPPPVRKVVAYGLDMNPEQTRAVVSVALWSEGGIYVEVAEQFDLPMVGADAVVAWLIERAGKRAPVVMDGYSPARTLEPGLRKGRVKLWALSAGELLQACGGFYQAAKDGTLSHYGQKELDDSVKGAVKQKLGDAGGWKWSRKSLETDLVPLMATTCAWFGANKTKRRPVRDESSSGRAVTVVRRR